MIRSLFLLIMLSVTLNIVLGQAPAGINYQAAVRDNAGNILSNENVTFRLTVQQGSAGGTSVYEETHATTTNATGIANLVIGTGVPASGVFTQIDWSNGPYFLMVELSTSTTSFQVLGTTQLLSVPYALFSQRTGDKLKPGKGVTIANDTINTSWSANGSSIYSNNIDNVGIGVSAPAQKLDVNGAVKISNTVVTDPGSIRYTPSGDFEGATPSGWKSLTKAIVPYTELNAGTYVSSTDRNTMVIGLDSLVVPETGAYLIMYSGRGYNGNVYDLNTGVSDLEGVTGVLNVTNNLNWVGQSYTFMFGTYENTTATATYRSYFPQAYHMTTYAVLNQGDVLKPGAVVFSAGTPTTSWSFVPAKIRLVKLN